jgi:hypothetical protein
MNKRILAFIAATGIIAASASIVKAGASGQQVQRPYEWTIQIKTQQLERQFQYNTSDLKEVVKASLQYYPMNNQDAKVDYEDLWYSKARTLGLDRHHKLEIKQGDAVAIRVQHNADSAPIDEQRAAGKAIMKAVVDANRNKNMVATIKVPFASFHTISSEIQNYHFAPVSDSGGGEDPINSDMNLFLESEPAGLTQSFAHYH